MRVPHEQITEHTTAKKNACAHVSALFGRVCVHVRARNASIPRLVLALIFCGRRTTHAQSAEHSLPTWRVLCTELRRRRCRRVLVRYVRAHTLHMCVCDGCVRAGEFVCG